MIGAAPKQAVKVITETSASVIGSNCGQGIDGFLQICERYRAASDLPIWMKGYAGLPRMEGEKTVYSQTSEAFAESAEKLLDLGARLSAAAAEQHRTIFGNSVNGQIEGKRAERADFE